MPNPTVPGRTSLVTWLFSSIPFRTDRAHDSRGFFKRAIEKLVRSGQSLQPYHTMPDVTYPGCGLAAATVPVAQKPLNCSFAPLISSVCRLISACSV
jgi:hypothetical protein